MTTTIQITNPVSVKYVKIYQLTSASAVPKPAGTFAVHNNKYEYAMPAYSVSTLVFTAGSPSPKFGQSPIEKGEFSCQIHTCDW
jgi:hypothetical protein